MHVHNLVINVHITIFYFAILKSPYKDPIVPLVSVVTTRNVIEQNPIGFPNFMFPSCGSYQLVFGAVYPSIGTTPTWPQMVEPITNNVLAPKLISRVLEIINIENPLDDDMSSKRRHNPKLP
jgi:hypothetical protein